MTHLLSLVLSDKLEHAAKSTSSQSSCGTEIEPISVDLLRLYSGLSAHLGSVSLEFQGALCICVLPRSVKFKRAQSSGLESGVRQGDLKPAEKLLDSLLAKTQPKEDIGRSN